MNVIANAGTIRSRVVEPINLQFGSVRGGGGKRQRNQVSFRVVDFADLTAFVGSRSVEITQTHGSQSVSSAVSRKRVFEKKLRRAIGVDWRARRLLRNWNLLDRSLPGNTVHSTARGKYNAADASFQRGVQQAKRTENIIPEILA